QNEILTANQCDFDVVATRQTFVEVRCRVESAESATGNNDFSFHHSVVVRFRFTHARVIESEKGVPLLGGITENAEPTRSGTPRLRDHLRLFFRRNGRSKRLPDK